MQENNKRRPSFKDYLNLVKIRLSLAVSFSAATGYLLLDSDPGFDFAFLLAGILLLTCGSSSLNQYTEREQDAVMKRTMNRPAASGAISGDSALAISAFLITAGSLLLFITGIRPFILGCSGVILYNLFYTYLKKVTPFAIIPGALVGSVPPLIGYTSAGGTILKDQIILFAVFMLLWQIPHFLLLLLRYGKEYREAGFKTFYDWLNTRQIKMIATFWMIISCVFLVSYTYYREVFEPPVSLAIFILTIVFLTIYLVSMVSRDAEKGLKYSFAIINLYSFLLMILLIAGSFVS